jgi:hypothetical protein
MKNSKIQLRFLFKTLLDHAGLGRPHKNLVGQSLKVTLQGKKKSMSPGGLILSDSEPEFHADPAARYP